MSESESEFLYHMTGYTETSCSTASNYREKECLLRVKQSMSIKEFYFLGSLNQLFVKVILITLTVCKALNCMMAN